MQDDLTWCVQKAALMPWILNLPTAMSATCWVLLLLGYVYVSGFLLYIVIQFDTKYKHRNRRDWHYTTWLIAMPSMIGLGQRFHPLSWRLRFFYAWMLLAMVIMMQIIMAFLYEYLQVRFPMHQIATVDEINSNGLVLMGSTRVWSLISLDDKVSEAVSLESPLSWINFCHFS